MEKKKKKNVEKKRQMVCKECGLIITVENECECMDSCDVICCGEQMKTKNKTASSQRA